MVIKRLVERMELPTVYSVLFLTLFYWSIELVTSYISHSLTVTIHLYLVLCNLIALVGYTISFKYCYVEVDESTSSCNSSTEIPNLSISVISLPASQEYERCVPCASPSWTCENKDKKKSRVRSSERKLKNTFGWARIDILVMTIRCLFFSALCLNVVMDAILTLVHINHLDQIHHTIAVFCIGFAGIALNMFTYILIGGSSSLHRGKFLNTCTESEIPTANAELNAEVKSDTKCQQFIEFLMDSVGSIFVIICAIATHFTDDECAKYIDPVMALISGTLLFAFSYPLMKESCMILLQTIPGHINIESLCNQLIQTHPDILNVHDLHVWQLADMKTIVCTVHIIFLNPATYLNTKKQIMNYFQVKGITQVTIQPEFFKNVHHNMISECPEKCLMKCQLPTCNEMRCCNLSSACEKPMVVVEKLPKFEQVSVSVP